MKLDAINCILSSFHALLMIDTEVGHTHRHHKLSPCHSN